MKITIMENGPVLVEVNEATLKKREGRGKD